MKSNSIELVTEFDSIGVPTNTQTFVTRPTIKFFLVYECVSFLASLKANPNNNEMHQMVDLVIRIYDNQFTKSQIMNGLDSENAIIELYKQIIFVASGKHIDEEVSDDVKATKVNSWEDHKNNLKAQIKDMTKNGNQSVNTVLDMPFYFVFDELNGETKKKQHVDSMFDAFGMS
ncbi:hypothetical protein AABD40_11685 [Staphylococcus shinii]|jgi:hypothetical protein|uniref:phage tail assembly chaperone GT n=1 Tax=Staphylococcus TaxID=1279 RepID=UPI00189D7189|nr:hypothetical protein [Staphylococcus kloosii]MBF7028935.1 hypothetical protein [Staphylococcus kloosii]